MFFGANALYWQQPRVVCVCVLIRLFIAHPIYVSHKLLVRVEPITKINHSALGKELKLTELLRLTKNISILGYLIISILLSFYQVWMLKKQSTQYFFFFSLSIWLFNRGIEWFQWSLVFTSYILKYMIYYVTIFNNFLNNQSVVEIYINFSF